MELTAVDTMLKDLVHAAQKAMENMVVETTAMAYVFMALVLLVCIVAEAVLGDSKLAVPIKVVTIKM
jgi:hypothetical protein